MVSLWWTCPLKRRCDFIISLRREVTNGDVKHQKEEEKPKTNGYHLENGHGETEEPAHADEIIKPGQNGTGPGLATQLEALNMDGGNFAAVSSRFGEFGGQYVPEELEEGFNKVKNDPKFWEDFRLYYPLTPSGTTDGACRWG